MKILWVFFSFVLFVFLFSVIFAFPLKWLWNWLMPVIFNLPTITVWQSLGLMILSGFLVRSSLIYNDS